MLSAGGCDWRAKHRHAAKRSHLTSEVRGRSQEDPMPEGQQPRGATPRQRSGGPLRGDTQRPRSGAATRGVTPRLRSGVVAGRRYPHAPKPKARGGGWEEQPHALGQGWWPGGPDPASKKPWLWGHRRA